jgi:protocatechuate 3,4-dioxygenase beta subunit
MLAETDSRVKLEAELDSTDWPGYVLTAPISVRGAHRRLNVGDRVLSKNGRKRMLTRIAPLAYCAMVLVLAGCVSGQVTDAATGQPIAGATVTFRDAAGNVGTATTGEDGLYSFDGITSPEPAPGLVQFELSAPGYAMLRVDRDVQYDDNEGHTLAVVDFLLIPVRG